MPFLYIFETLICCSFRSAHWNVSDLIIIIQEKQISAR